MKLTDQNLAEKLHITAREIVRRKELVCLEQADVELLLGCKPIIAEQINEIVDEFYADQVSKPEVERLIGDSGTLSRLKHHTQNYLLTMFDGIYDDIYVLSRLRVGVVHDRIGVPPKLYVSSMRTLLNILRRRLQANTALKDKCKQCLSIQAALEKIIIFDLTLVFDTYIHSLLDQVELRKDEIELYAKGLEEEVASRTKELSEMARRDPLTGLINRRTMFEELRREIARSLRHGQPITLAYIDMDHFKEVNDAHGHQEGDKILQSLATAMRKVLRAEDLSARIGGDEFCIILPGADFTTSREVLSRLVGIFDELKGEHMVTLSVGLASLSLELPQMPEELVKQADQAMYRAKETPGHSFVNA